MIEWKNPVKGLNGGFLEVIPEVIPEGSLGEIIGGISGGNLVGISDVLPKKVLELSLRES